MLICDCNGWNDAPEDERDALDAYEPVIQAQLYHPEYPPAPNGQMLELAPDDVAGVGPFLWSPDSGFVTGHTIPADGGRLAVESRGRFRP